MVLFILYSLVPSGKVRDCTLAFMQDGVRYVLIISSAGHIYYQPLVSEASAVNGPFYVTNTMEVNHSALENLAASEQLGGGGVSIYYCQTLQCLFFSYVQGMTFMASMREVKDDALTCLTQIVLAKNKNNGTPQPLCQWSDVSGHPGLVTAFLQQSNNPVIIMVKPDSLSVQEIKVGSKAKIIDMVAIRHSSSNSTASNSQQDQNNKSERTTLILLCEDGSLKIYMAGVEATGYWLSSSLNPLSYLMMKPPRKKRAALPKPHHRSSGALSFPVDFFEHCSTISDIEFGGQDVLQVYSVQQVKHRLQTASCYIANTKPMGFKLEVMNNDPTQVIVGVRVMLGCIDINRVPSYIEIFGRNLAVNLTRSRWFDFPLTKEESLQVKLLMVCYCLEYLWFLVYRRTKRSRSTSARRSTPVVSTLWTTCRSMAKPKRALAGRMIKMNSPDRRPRARGWPLWVAVGTTPMMVARVEAAMA